MSQPDLVLRDATILDGSGGAATRGDVAICGERITQVGTAASGAREIDAQGKVLCPGFIDTHAHDDAALLSHPGMAFKLAQGCTSVVIGNCGFSAAPIEPGRAQVPGNASLFSGLEPKWEDLAGYNRAAQRQNPAVNWLSLVGHNTVRWQVMGDAERAPTPSELTRMRGLIEQALEQGACGLSTGLIYRPGKFALTEELIELATTLKAYGALYTTHLRSESDALLDAVTEALNIGRAAGCAVHISHHKAAGRRNWGRVRESLELVDEANAAGADVSLDMYPYTMGSGPMVEYFDLQAINLDLAQVMRIAKCPAFPDYEGRPLPDIASATEQSLESLVRQILTAPLGDKTICIQLLTSEADLETNLRHPRMMVGSDGIADLQGKPHPRLFGTMPRILGEFVRQRGVLPLEEAVHRMTGLAAQRFGLNDRGAVQPGYMADLVLFDREQVRDTATYDDPKQEPAGIELVIVGGHIALEGGRHTGAGAGRVLAPEFQH